MSRTFEASLVCVVTIEDSYLTFQRLLCYPLIRLTKKNVEFNWSAECQTAFDFLKESLTTVPVLAYPDPNKPYILYTDASDTCIGACLSQIDEETKEERPIYFLSHKLTTT